MRSTLFIIWLAMAPWAAAQSLKVYSEFRRINPQGEVAAPDRGGRPREILSPAVARNAFASFHLVVSLPPNVPFILHIGQNPENAVRVDVYREIFVKLGREWIPDGLEQVALPFRGLIPEDCRSLAFWMDVWVPDTGPARRIKVEPQLNFGDRWIIYPMEVRIKHVRVPPVASARGARAQIGHPSDAAARRALQDYLCGGTQATPDGPPTVRRMIGRNARQDMALAQRLESRLGRDQITSALLGTLGASHLRAWCAEPAFPTDRGPEWYLGIRDFLFRAEDP